MEGAISENSYFQVVIICRNANQVTLLLNDTAISNSPCMLLAHRHSYRSGNEYVLFSHTFICSCKSHIYPCEHRSRQQIMHLILKYSKLNTLLCFFT